MPPYIPLLSISRSQSIRIGRGPGNSVVNELNLGDIATNPHTGALISLFYADLGNPNVRKDYQHHAAMGAVESIGNASLTTSSDLFRVSGLAVTAGTGFGINVAAGLIQSRFYGGQLATALQTVTPAPPSTSDRTDLVVLNNAGVASVVAGVAGGVPTYEVDSVVTSGVPTGGTFTLQFTYDGNTYTTAPIAFNASAAAVASALAAATGGPALPGTLTGSGGPLPTAVTITASGAFEGPITGQIGNGAGLTGGTAPAVAFTRTTQGTGGSPAPTFPAGNTMTLAEVFIPSTATSSTNYTFTNVTPTS